MISMTEKKTFVLRIKADTLKHIEKWAADEFRSINGQIEWMLNKCLKDHGQSDERNKKTG